MVVYEDTKNREEAVRFCDRLIERFWSEHGFYLSWWSFASLQEGPLAEAPTEKALEADLIIFATEPEGDLPDHVQEWTEEWLRRRGDREGAVVALTGSGTAGPGKSVYLRNIAHRAGMDYLTEVPQTILLSIPDSLESVSRRADEVTSVLDEILRTHRPPHLAENA